MFNEIFMQNLNLGLVITFIGMVSVLAFLTLMVFTIKIANIIIEKLNIVFPECIKEPNKPIKKQKSDNDEYIALSILLSYLRKNRLE